MTDLKIARIADGLTVSPQLRPEDFPALAAQGVKMIVNNRPDGEEPGQLSAEDARRLATSNGMEYRHIPIKLPELSERDIGQFDDALKAASGPVHAHCRSGVRSITAWALREIRAGHLSPDEARTKIEAAGFDPRPALQWLAGHPGRAPS